MQHLSHPQSANMLNAFKKTFWMKNSCIPSLKIYFYEQKIDACGQNHFMRRSLATIYLPLTVSIFSILN